jgi:hypothetical protein
MRGTATPAARNILFITYHFPPSAAVGGRRIANFATTLRTLGWEPRVLTIADDDIEILDRGRLSDVQGIPVQKARVRRSLFTLASWFWAHRPRLSVARRERYVTPKGGASAAPVHPRRSARLRRFVLSFLALPDWQRGWCLPATMAALRTIRRERVGWFMTSCPPYSVHLIGLAVKALTGRRWVADFRDPWMTTGWKRLYPTSPLSMRIEAGIERRVVERADLLVFNVKRLRDAYRIRYSVLDPAKFVFVPNGIVLDSKEASPARFDRFTITYTGSLYVGRSPEPVFAAIAHLIRLGTVPAEAIRLRLVGQCGAIDGIPTSTAIARHGLESVVEVVDAVPYRDAFDMVQRSHLALLLAPNLPYQVPAKVYDYLRAGTRILAIAEDGATADLLQETASGEAFRTDDIEGIAAFIRREFDSRQGERYPFVDLGRYDVRHITNELVEHITRIEAQAGLP